MAIHRLNPATSRNGAEAIIATPDKIKIHSFSLKYFVIESLEIRNYHSAGDPP